MSKTVLEAICELTKALGVERVNELEGCWEHELDDHWKIAINGHREPKKAFGDVTVQPFHFYVELNGFPAGMFHPAHGGMFAAGLAANEETFVAAVEDACSRIGKDDGLSTL